MPSLLSIFDILFIFRAFDVELLHIAQNFNLHVGEVAINWQEIEGGSLWWNMLTFIAASFCQQMSCNTKFTNHWDPTFAGLSI